MKVGVIQPAIRQTAFAAAVGVNLLKTRPLDVSEYARRNGTVPLTH
jgi:hypothetical protein